jgi:hypothetical protein
MMSGERRIFQLCLVLEDAHSLVPEFSTKAGGDRSLAMTPTATVAAFVETLMTIRSSVAGVSA